MLHVRLGHLKCSDYALHLLMLRVHLGQSVVIMLYIY